MFAIIPFRLTTQPMNEITGFHSTVGVGSTKTSYSSEM